MDTIDELRRRLTEQAYLFDDPRSYRAGVEQALAAVAPLWREQTAQLLRPTGGSEVRAVARSYQRP